MSETTSQGQAFKPSQVQLAPDAPLVATMGRAELEHAAAMIVRACQVSGDVWQPIAPTRMGVVINDDLAAKREPFHSLNTNPFFRPDFRGLVEKGFARWTADGSGAPIELTAEGIARLSRWVVLPAPTPPATDS